MINHPGRSPSPIMRAVRAIVGPRSSITRDDMRRVLAELAAQGLVELDNGWQKPRDDGDHASAWTDMCRNITVISVLDWDRDASPRAGGGSNPGTIRHDEPGNMAPNTMVTLMFAPASLRDHPYDQIGFLRRHARRVLVVRD